MRSDRWSRSFRGCCCSAAVFSRSIGYSAGGAWGVWRWVSAILPKQDWAAKLGGIGSFQTELERIYATRRAGGWSRFWRLAGWFAGAAEIWLCLWFLGVPAHWTDAVILESLSQAGRSAAFTVPGAIGVQEAGFVALGLVLGLDPSTALAWA